MTTNTNMKRILIAIVIILSALAAKAETIKGSVVDSLNPQDYNNRSSGLSVRLVR